MTPLIGWALLSTMALFFHRQVFGALHDVLAVPARVVLHVEDFCNKSAVASGRLAPRSALMILGAASKAWLLRQVLGCADYSRLPDPQSVVPAVIAKRRPKIAGHLVRPVVRDRAGPTFMASWPTLLDPGQTTRPERNTCFCLRICGTSSTVRKGRHRLSRFDGLPGIRATVLFLPYDANLGEVAWGRFFEQAGAFSITLLDTAMSRATSLLPAVRCPSGYTGQVQ